jgi:predicted dehydrogenase
MGRQRRISRRRFLQRTARAGIGAVAAPMILPACTLAAQNRRGADDRINIGYIGVGRRARQLMKLPRDAQIVAVSDVNRNRLEEMTSVPRGKNWRTYQDYREMLAADDIDAVIVASPDHWHALHVIHACEANKDAYVEKPMSLTIREGRAMVEAARKHGRIVQVGSQQRSNPENRFACELVRNGRIGRVKKVHGDNYPSPWECPLPAQPTPDYIDWDMWCGQTEPRSYHEELYLPRVRGQEAGWISYRPYSGGEMTGWGAHGLDQIQWALGMDDSGPVAVEPLLDRVPKDDGVHKGPRCEVQYTFRDGTPVVLDGKGAGGGGLFGGELGTIAINRGEYKVSGKVDTGPIPDGGIHLYDSRENTLSSGSSDDTAMHIGNWLHCVRTRQHPASDIEIGHRATVLCHLGNIARWTRRKLAWDPVKERFLDDDDANTYLERPMRAPWVI